MTTSNTEPSNLARARIRFAARWLPILAKFVAVSDIRYYLNGLHIESAAPKPGVYLVATNGHMMAVVYDETGEIDDQPHGATLKINAALVAACRSGKLPYGHVLEVVISGGRVHVAPGFDGIATDLERYVMPGHQWWVEGRFPDFRRVLPADWAKLKIGFECHLNGAYLAAFAGIGASKKPWGSTVLTLWQEAPEKAVVVQVDRLPELVGLIMPIRGDVPMEVARDRLSNIIERKAAA